MVFYADVYFLINFTVDVLAIYFAASAARVPSSIKRILSLGAIGAALAVLCVLFTTSMLAEIGLAALYFTFVGALISPKISIYRRVKATALFAVFEALVGGIVGFGYEFLDRHLYARLKDTDSSAPNRRLLILSVMILLSIGVFKIFLLFFSRASSERSVIVELKMLGRTLTLEALTDTGNLLKEPSTMRPVILIKENALEQTFPELCTDVSKICTLDAALVKRICLIPMSKVGSKSLLVGFRPDEINVISESKKHSIDAVIAQDTEEGTYGGFYALMPAAAIDDVV